MEIENETLINVKLSTKFEKYRIGASAISIPTRFGRLELSKLVNEALELETVQPFDFIASGKLLRTTLSEYMSSNSLSSESVIELEYVPILPKPEEKSSEDLPDWVSGIAHTGGLQVIGCYDGSVNVYSDTNKQLCSSILHSRPIKCVDCATISDSVYVSSCGLDNTLLISTFADHTIYPKFACKGHDAHVLCCKINPISGICGSGAWNGSILLWNVTKAKEDGKEIEPVGILSEGSEGVNSLCWTSANDAVSGGWDHIIRVWDVESGGMKQEIKGNKVITKIDSNANDTLITSHPDGNVRLWDYRSEKPLIATLLGRKTFTSTVAWNPANSNLCMSGDYEGGVIIYDIRSAYPLHICEKVHDGKILCSAWSNDMIYTGGEDKKLKRLSSSF